MTRRVLITGSRNWRAVDSVYNALSAQFHTYGHIVVVHGDARGADAIAAQWAMANPRISTNEPHPAQWHVFGKRAGFLRNQYMVDLGADICLAFPMPGSVGTLHCMRVAAKAGIPVVNLGV